jgi:DNA ligase D-like protein (predicted ligase)
MSAEPEAGQLSIELEGFPGAVRPMQAVSAEAPFSSSEYLFEVKWDGIRCLAFVHPDGHVHLQDRRLDDITAMAPEIVDALSRLPPGTVLDGELVATDEEGRPDQQALRTRLNQGSGSPLSYLAFDLLYHEGRPQLRQTLARRRARLKKAVPSAGGLFVSDYIAGDGVELFEACLERGLEGVVAKHVDSTYVPGQRSPFWLKVKAVTADDFVVTGFTAGEPFGALLVGYYERGRLLPAGSVAGGFDRETATRVAAELRRLETAESPLEPPPIMTAPVRWVKPELVITVRYSEWSPDGTLRFPIFETLRPEIHPGECVRRRPRVVLGGRARPGTPAFDLTRFPF